MKITASSGLNAEPAFYGRVNGAVNQESAFSEHVHVVVGDRERYDEAGPGFDLSAPSRPATVSRPKIKLGDGAGGRRSAALRDQPGGTFGSETDRRAPSRPAMSRCRWDRRLTYFRGF